jgi:uncharacterized protein YdhG (YjbR/CyaY superfamily)
MATSVDDYIAEFPADIQEILQQVRQTILAAVPDAGEKISYQIPTVTMNDEALLYFSGWKQHISVYPVPTGDETLTTALAPYLSGKSTLKFPLNKPIPYDVISRLTQAFVTSRTTNNPTTSE